MELNLTYVDIALDIAKHDNYEYIYAKQYDKSTRFIRISLTENDVPYTILDGTIARFRCTKPDNKYIINDSTSEDGTVVINGNTIIVELTEQVLAMHGTIRADIGLYQTLTEISVDEHKNEIQKNITTLLSSSLFYINIEQAGYDDQAIQSTNEFCALTSALDRSERVYEMVEKCEEVTNECKEATDYMMGKFSTLEDLVGQATDNAEYLNGLTTRAETAATNAKTSETNAKASAISADNDATIAFTQAERAKNYADIASSAKDVTVIAKNETVKLLDEFNKNIDNFRKKDTAIAINDLTPALQNSINSIPDSDNIRYKTESIKESDLDYALALKINNAGNGGGSSGSGGITVTGAQIDDNRPSYSKVYSSKYSEQVMESIANEVVSGLDLSGVMTQAERIKLARIEDNANYYVHPSYHNWTMIETTEDAQFISSLEKESYSDKYTKTEIDNKLAAFGNGIIPKPYVEKYADIIITYPNPEKGWRVPTSEGAYIFDGELWLKSGNDIAPIATTTVDGLMSADMVRKLSTIAQGANNYIHPNTHSTEMITPSTDKNFVTDAQLTKIDNIDSDLSTKLLKYRENSVKIKETDLDQAFLDKVANAGGTIINDGVISSAQTYSSAMIELQLKNVDDKITTALSTGLSLASLDEIEALFV